MFRLWRVTVKTAWKNQFREAEVDPDGHQNADNGRLASSDSPSRQPENKNDSDLGKWNYKTYDVNHYKQSCTTASILLRKISVNLV
jgi:hypothetical protein